MNEVLSLLKYCRKCRSKCCAADSIGSPILTMQEIQAIRQITAAGRFAKVRSSTGQEYYIIEEPEGIKKCAFLGPNGKCIIQKAKPLCCQCYPVKALWDEKDSVSFFVDEQCPAVEYLTPEFIERARQVALQSITCFDKVTYEHWLENYIGLVAWKPLQDILTNQEQNAKISV